MYKILKEIYYKILMLLPTKAIVYIENYRAYKRKLNLKNPEYFGEKIQWIKLYGHLEQYSEYVDKYKVRQYIKDTIGEEYLIPLIATYDSADKINFDELPNQFVLKCNHGSGYNIICKDKSKIDIEKIKKKLNKWMKEDFYKIKGEVQYKHVEKKIICEKYIVDKDNELKDYRFFCFDGKPYMVLVDTELHGTNPKRDFYDMDWNKMELRNVEPNSKYVLEKPKSFELMKKISEELSKDFQFVRIDLYNVDGKIYFGEITLTHTGGRKPFSPLEKDKELAQKIDLRRCNRKSNVLMIGPDRTVKGGMTTVVDNYFKCDIDKKVNLCYLGACITEGSKLYRLSKMIKPYIRYRQLIENYDIIHVHMASRGSTFRKGEYIRVAKKKGKKVIVHIHGAEYKTFFEKECSRRQREKVKQILNMCDNLIVLSEEWKEYFKTLVPQDKIVVMYNSIIIPENFEKNLDTQKMLFLGRFGHRKGIYDLIEVLEKIVKKYPNVKLYAGGDGETEQVCNMIKNKKIEKNFQFLGWVVEEEKEKYLKDCSIYILPSYNEGMPMSVLEAMSYKNVTISTNVGGIPQVIENEIDGILIKPGDRAILYEVLDTVLKDKELRNRLSNNARDKITKKFNTQKNIEELIKIYTSQGEINEKK